MNDFDAITRQIDADRLTRLVIEAVDEYSPSFSEGPATQVFTDALERAGIPYRLQPVPGPYDDETRANIVIELGEGPPELLWVGHVDTVPLQHFEETATEREDGDILYGLGAADMKSGCAAIIEALIAVRESGLPLRRGLTVGLVVGEEEYGDGAQALLDAVHAPLVVVGEPTGLLPCTSHYGYLELRLQASGTRAHAALPEAGANAIHAMLAWMLQILDGAVRLRLPEPLAVNPRQIQGGTGQFVVADACEAMLDVHLPPGVDGELPRQIVDEALEVARAGHPACELSYEPVFWSPGYALEPDSARLGALQRAFALADLPYAPGTFRSHSDASLFHRKGAHPVVCGPGRLELAHVRDEWVSLSEVHQAARLYAAMIYEACIRE